MKTLVKMTTGPILFAMICCAPIVVDQSASAKTFDQPKIIRQQVRFWEKIFHKYPSTTVIIHEMDPPNRIIDLIDYKTYAAEEHIPTPVPRKFRNEITEKYLTRYQLAMDRFNALGKDATKFGAIERRVYNVFKKSPYALKRLFNGKIEIRGQTGLSDDFVAATATARAYFPFMERTFREHGVPTQLTRLPFVESMFNTQAVSKVGASGVWQFMPYTAKGFVTVNDLVDERNNIYKATEAAARLLASNYRILKSWPLAITAYNHGATGMLRAKKKLRTSNIGTIVKHYKSRSFGFASRNFYAEFIAAAKTYNKLKKSGDALPPLILEPTASIALNQKHSIRSLLKTTKIPVSILREFNPELTDEAFDKMNMKPLPANLKIRVPNNIYNTTKTRLDKNHPKIARK